MPRLVRRLPVESDTHCLRVSRYCALIARQLGRDAEALAAAARLHDIGMLATAGDALEAPSPLTSRQRRALHAHTTVGHAILAGAFALAADIALHHHERYDGGGYPHGLAGDAIPESARILAVADVFDALTTDRPYRRAARVPEAAAVLGAERRAHLDPVIVDAFLAVLDDAAAILAACPPRPEERLAALVPARPPLTLNAAAAVLGVTPSRLRRWADEDRLEVVRTTGGHRRFPVQEVERLAAELGRGADIRRVLPPDRPLPEVAHILSTSGAALAVAAARAIYTGGRAGWFASPASAGAVTDWLEATRAACAHGVYEGALAAVAALMRHAEAHATTTLERHAFLDRFGQALTRALVREGEVERTELAGARRLVVVMQQEALTERPVT